MDEGVGLKGGLSLRIRDLVPQRRRQESEGTPVKLLEEVVSMSMLDVEVSQANPNSVGQL